MFEMKHVCFYYFRKNGKKRSSRDNVSVQEHRFASNRVQIMFNYCINSMYNNTQ